MLWFSSRKVKFRYQTLYSFSLLLFFIVWNNIKVALAFKGGRVIRMSGVSGKLLQDVRIELFFKTQDQLKERVRMLSNAGVCKYNLVNKNDKDSLLEWTQAIRKEQPEAHVSLHFSLKYQKVKRATGVDQHYNKMTRFLKNVPPNQETLLISGSGKMKGWDSSVALQKLQVDTNYDHSKSCPLAVAYNPFFPEEKDRKEEFQYLKAKLDTNLVSKVYLQFGTDTTLLENALRFLRKYLERNNMGHVQIAGSVFLPTKKLIAQQKFRPWNGVFLSEDFLSGPDMAEDIVVDILRIYQTYKVEPLIEAPGVVSEKDLEVVQYLLVKSASKSRDGSKEKMKLEDTSNNDDDNKLGNKRPKLNQNENAGNKQKQQQSKSVADKGFVVQKTLSGRKPQREVAIVLFGSHDVRLHDNYAVFQAISRHSQVLPVFLWQESDLPWGVKGCIEVVLKDALRHLEKTLKEQYGLPLICRNTNDQIEEICSIVQEWRSNRFDSFGEEQYIVYFNRDHTPEGREFDLNRSRALNSIGVDAVGCQSSLLYDVEKLDLTKGFHGGHWGTLMPFLKACKKQFGDPPRPMPTIQVSKRLKELESPAMIPSGIKVKDLNLAKMPPKTKWDKPILERFPMSSESANRRLELFYARGLPKYESERSRADKDLSTSQLSVYLRIGVLSPFEVYWKTEDSKLSYDLKKTFYRRLFWRDLAYYQLFCFPRMRDVCMREHYENVEWVQGKEESRRFQAWKQGKTGFPMVDAGMRELYKTGWMNQTVRMVVASFAVEYLRIDWKKAAHWFHYTLADADSAINYMMWQNAGRSGVDQWNFVLSPTAGSQDPTGEYVAKWLPELARLPKKYRHCPWEVPKVELASYGVVLGRNYPERIITNLKVERDKSVCAVLNMRRNAQHRNDDRGYDLVTLPNGEDTVVFTKQEYRISRSGRVLSSYEKKTAREKKRTNERTMPPRQNIETKAKVFSAEDKINQDQIGSNFRQKMEWRHLLKEKQTPSVGN